MACYLRHMNTKQQFAEKLLQISALKINLQTPYTWASGWRSPVYCDNRQVLSHPYTRDFVKSELANMMLEHFPEADAIAGVATAGIAHGVLAADLLKVPFAYVRSKPKEHGMGNQIEGELQPGSRVVVVEDLVSTGKSSLQAVAALRAAGATIGLKHWFCPRLKHLLIATPQGGCASRPVAPVPLLLPVLFAWLLQSAPDNRK